MTHVKIQTKIHQTRRARKKHKTNPYIEQLARPRLGIITHKYVSPAERFDRRKRTFSCRCPGGSCRNAFFGPSPWLRRIRPATSRLVCLAKPVPRNVSRKYRPAKYRRKTYPANAAAKCPQILRPCNAKSTRTEQLALPYPRLLLDTKRVCRSYVSQHRIGIINKNMQLSMHTVYSKLANVQMPNQRKPREKWTDADWKKHNDWAASRAKPKRHIFQQQIIQQRPRRPIDYIRIDRLAKPVRPVPIYVDTGHKVSDPIQPISRAVLNFKMTPHYTFLATPFKPVEADDEFEPYESPYEVPRDYAKIKTVGIQQLAEPRLGIKTKRYQRGDNASIVFEVSKMAMKAKPSEKTKKLAEPRKNMQEEAKPNPFSVKPAACAKKPMPPAKVEYYVKLSTPVKRGG